MARKDRFGNGFGTTAAALNALMGDVPFTSKSLYEKIKEIKPERIRKHIKFLKDKGNIAKNGDGEYETSN